MPPTITRHHAEWLSLLEISGPFLSMPVLQSVFPQGLDDFPPEEARSLRADYEYWKENAAIAGDAATHTAWAISMARTFTNTRIPGRGSTRTGTASSSTMAGTRCPAS